MTEEQTRKLENLSMIGRNVHFKIKGMNEKAVYGKVVDEVYLIVEDYKHLIQKIKITHEFWKRSEYGYRTGYYTWDAHKRRIVWGQYTQVLTQEEYKELLAKAKERKWEIFS